MRCNCDYCCKALDSFGRKLFIVSPDFRILSANSFAIRKNRPDIQGQLCFEYFHDLQAPCAKCPVPDVLATRTTIVRRMKYPWSYEKDNLCLQASPILGEGGDEIEAVTVVDLDLTHLTRLENELKRSNAFLRNLIMSSVDGVIAADMKGRILIFNAAASQVSGYSIEEALTSLNIRNFYPEDGARDIMRKLRSDDFGGKGKLVATEVECLAKDGSPVPIRLSAAIVYEGDQEVATVGFFYDLREKIAMESRLQKTQLQLLQAEKMSSLGKLAAGVAHQLNNPLGGITLYAQLMLEEYPLEEAAVQDLTRIIQDAERCRNTVKELLEFARQTRQEIRLNDINHALSQTLYLLENQTTFHNIEIARDLDPDLPKVPSDIQQLNHVFMNIILNAAEAMEGSGRLTVETRLSEDGEKARIRISDTGPGIPPDVMAHIFDPFFTTKEQGKGTGLGLSMVYGIIEEHKGKVKVQSRPGEGATFIVELPLNRTVQTP
jgi:two-component system, NtrC family, sensor kinase